MAGSDDKPKAASRSIDKRATDGREARLAAALRANLRRRKAPRDAGVKDKPKA